MAITVVTPATSTRLARLADIKDELGVTSGDDNKLLRRLIDEATAAIQEWCGRTFAKATYSETVAGHGSTNLILNRWPIVSVTSINRDGSPITDFTLQEPDEGLVYRQAGWGWEPQKVSGSLSAASAIPWPNSEKFLYTVVYIAGYDLPTDLLPNLPLGIQRACIITVKDWYANRGRNTSLKKKSGPGVSFDFNEPDALPAAAIQLLGRHRVAA